MAVGTEQFNRKHKLTIYSGSRVILNDSTLRIAFNIPKGLSSTPNKVEMVIFGLSETTRNSIRQTDNRTVLQAGYPDNIDVIFDGSVTKIEAERGDSTIKTKITAGDGAKGVKYGAVSASVTGGSPLKTLIIQIAESMPGVGIGNLAGLDGKVIGGRGQSVSGKASVILDSLGVMFSFGWSVQDGLLETLAVEKGKAGSVIGDSGRNAYVISPATGMIGIPSVLDNGQVKVKSLLNPRIKPGRVVKVETQRAPGSGFYKSTEVVFKGDTYGGEWSVDITGAPL